MVQALRVAKANLSQHLSLMRQKGIVSDPASRHYHLLSPRHPPPSPKQCEPHAGSAIGNARRQGQACTGVCSTRPTRRIRRREEENRQQPSEINAGQFFSPQLLHCLFIMQLTKFRQGDYRMVAAQRHGAPKDRPLGPGTSPGGWGPHRGRKARVAQALRVRRL